MAYLLVFINALSLPLHEFTNYIGDEHLSAAAMAFTLTAIVLGFFIPRIDKNRFVPAVLNFLLLICHTLLQKL